MCKCAKRPREARCHTYSALCAASLVRSTLCVVENVALPGQGAVLARPARPADALASNAEAIEALRVVVALAAAERVGADIDFWAKGRRQGRAQRRSVYKAATAAVGTSTGALAIDTLASEADTIFTQLAQHTGVGCWVSFQPAKTGRHAFCSAQRTVSRLAAGCPHCAFKVHGMPEAFTRVSREAAVVTAITTARLRMKCRACMVEWKSSVQNCVLLDGTPEKLVANQQTARTVNQTQSNKQKRKGRFTVQWVVASYNRFRAATLCMVWLFKRRWRSFWFLSSIVTSPELDVHNENGIAGPNRSTGSCSSRSEGKVLSQHKLSSRNQHSNDSRDGKSNAYDRTTLKVATKLGVDTARYSISCCRS